MPRAITPVRKIIREAFLSNPSESFSLSELIARAYPGLPETPARYIAVCRAAKPVAEELGWRKRRLKNNIIRYVGPGSVSSDKAKSAALFAENGLKSGQS